MKSLYLLKMRTWHTWLCFVLLLGLSNTGYAQLFNQTFSSGSSIPSYVSAPGAPNKFNSILTSGVGTVVTVPAPGVLSFARTSGSGTFSRSTNLAPVPSTMIYKLDLSVVCSSSTTNVAQFKVGDGFSATNTPELNSTTWGRFGIDFVASNQFRIRNLSSGTTSAAFSGTQAVMWVLNNGNSTITYTGANGSPETLQADRMDLWVGTTRVMDEMLSTTPTLTLADLKFVINAGTGTVIMDNININYAVGNVVCPANPIAQGNDLDECSGYVTMSAPSVVDACTSPVTLINDYNGTADASDIYAVGTTLVTWTITDACGNVTNCTQTVIVNDTQNPAFGSLSNFTAYTTSPSCSYTVVGGEFDPFITDNCYVSSLTYTISGATTGSGMSSLDGVTLNQGVNTVQWTAVDGNSNTVVSSSYTITVSDDDAPVISGCPGNIIQPRSCAGSVSWTPPTALDNCSAVTTTSNYNPGDNFPVGSTEVKYIFTDAAGNKDSCMFNVVINQLSTTHSASSFNGFNISCNGTNDGYIDLAVSNESGPLTYSWSGPGGFSSTSEDISGLIAGIYNVTITDGPCSITYSVTLTEPTPLSATPSMTPATCAGYTDGTISLSIGGGVPPYTYSLNGGPDFAYTGTITGLSPANYVITVKDANNCSINTGITVTSPPAIVINTVGNTGPVGHGSTISFNATATGGTGTLSYAWSGPNALSGSGASYSISNADRLATGLWTVTVSDVNGCSTTATTSAIVYHTSLYVNDAQAGTERWTTAPGNNANAGSTGDPLADLSFAYGVSQDGDTIFVDGGSYAVNTPIAITKSLKVFGANYDISAVSGTRNPEAILNFTGNTSMSADHISLSAASAIQFSGFRIEDNLSGVTGIRIAVRLTNSNGHVVANNYFWRQAATSSSGEIRAVMVDFSAPSTSATIDNNYFTGSSTGIFSNLSWKRGIWHQGGSGLSNITNNKFQYVRSHINLEDNINSASLVGNIFELDNTGATAISVGGSPIPSGTYTLGANDFRNNGVFVNLSNVAAGFYFDATSSSYNGNPFSGLSLAQYFDVEARMIHGTNNGKNGLVRVRNNNLYIIPASLDPSKGSIQRGVNTALTNDIINVKAGNYNEDVNVNKTVTVLGEGYATTIVSGPIGGSNSTFAIAAGGVILDGLSITRDGNTVAQWNLALNSAGVSVQSQGNYGEIRNCSIYGNRTGIDINNSNGNNIHNNIIDNNRTGMIFRNQTDNTNVSENFITNNWTAGVLFLDGSVGTNSPVQTAANSTFNNNNLSGNWYGDIVDRQSGGSLPAPGTNIKNFECNWFGAASQPTTSIANSTEPGYAAQIPVVYGGSAVAPGGQPNILGPASANIDYVTWLVNGTDNSGNNGFQPVGSSCTGAPVTLVLASQTNVDCNGNTNGALDITPGGGNGSYTFLWTGGATTEDISGLAAGTYTVVVTDGLGSTATASWTITQPVVLAISASSNSPVYAGAAVNFSSTPTGGTTPYSFSWTPGGSMVSATVEDPTITAAAVSDNGTYTVNIVDANGCTATATTALIVYGTDLYVNDNNTSGDVFTTAVGNNANAGTTSAPFRDIQYALSIAQPGNNIWVDAGSYVENITVSTNVNLYGANYNISPNTGSRNAESVITPATSDPDPYSVTSAAIMYLSGTRNNVDIKGFTFSGDNTSINSGVLINGVDVDAIEAIGAYEGISNVDVENNIFNTFSYAGIDFYNYYNGGASTTGNSVNDNRFVNIMPTGFGIGVLIYNNCYTDITNNVMLSTRIGVQTGNFYQADAGTSHDISNNAIESSRDGIFHNLAYTGASSFNIQNNNFTTYAGATNNNGILVSSIQSAVGANISNNNVTGAKYGINLWNCPTTNTITITGGTLTGCDVGVFANNYDGYSSDATTSAYAINGVNIQNSTTAGIYVKDNSANSNGATVSLSIGGATTVNNSSTGLKIEGAGASASFSGSAVAFTGQSVYIDQVTNGTDKPSTNIDATQVTFDGLTGGTATLAQNFAIEDKINHKVDNLELGYVAVKANNDFVTNNSYVSPNTTPSIQRGIDAASTGYTVNVQAGNYGKEVALNRSVFGVGSYQFGLYIDKDNLTVRGYDAGNAAITNPSNAAVEFTTGSTANFGPSGIFVQGNGVTIDGLKIGDNFDNSNVLSSNKSIEVIGDAFTMTNSWLNTSSNEGAFYMGIWDLAHPIETYTLNNNRFTNSLISINNGAGQTGAASGRVITNNTFDGLATPYLIGFRGWNGGSPVQGWIVYPVGGAVVTGNTFNNTGVENYILSRGNAGGTLNGQFNWSDIWSLNTYGNHVVTLTDYPSFDVRSYDHSGYTESRRITPFIQENESIGQTGDVVLVSDGAFNENVTVSHAVTLRGNNYNTSCSGVRAAESVISGSASTAVTITSDGVTINGFSITNPTGSYGVRESGRSNLAVLYNIISDIGDNAAGSGPSYGIQAESNAASSNVNFSNNCIDNIRGGQSTPTASANGSGVGIGANSSNSNFDMTGLVINNNIISNISACATNGTGGKGAYGVIINIGASPSNAGKAVNASVANNEISGLSGRWAHAIGLEGETPGASILNNKIDNLFSSSTPFVNAVGVYVEQNDGAATLTINENSFTNTAYGVVNVNGVGYAPDSVNANCNWYNSLNAGVIASRNAGKVKYSPWLTNGTDNSVAIGFQPVGGACSGTPLVIAETHVNVDCNGNSTGSIDITVTGGTAPSSLSYAWSNAAVTEDINTLAAGTYTVTVTDGNGSTATTSVTITEPAVLAASGVTTDVLCNGNSTGAIDLTVSGGTAPYNFVWSNGATTEDVSGLAAGTYTVTVDDANGCDPVYTFTITEPSALVLLISQ